MNTVTSRSLVHLALRAQWQEGETTHTALRHFEKFNVWRDLDLLPAPLQREILGQPAGHSASHRFAGGDLANPWEARLIRRIQPREFHKTTRRGVAVKPARGRFYPQGMADGVPGVFAESMQPMRLVELAGDHFTLDFNHPLAKSEIEVGVELFDIHGAPDEHGGRCNECIAELLAGPGMQMRYEGQPTDFFDGAPFRRVDDNPDGFFYSLSRMVPHLDRAALGQVADLYGRLLAGRGRVLDLMASWDSHLPQGLEPTELIGLGMNREELDANSRLTRRIIQDLNRDPILPFPDGSLDAVICTVSVEYLTRPLEVFREVNRLLAPGGLFVNSFSNRWFSTKAIALWGDLHEFERLGLVAEYYRQSGGWERLNTRSLHGLPRPEEDPHAGASPWSDPLYAVWGYKAG